MKLKTLIIALIFGLLLVSCDAAEEAAHGLVSIMFFLLKVGFIILGVYLVFIILVALFGGK
ncbi:hypothetical protein [Sunxiuqinia dokdonensis]|uniref:hypothetical protein n=1 Tax=Sunxiuqinia dokdonensis TaxID=1409788 RepID=UPI0012FA920F|nr:hypothetical protein [Sunxiuqinia dokdonensis]